MRAPRKETFWSLAASLACVLAAGAASSPSPPPVDVETSTGMRLVLLPAGTFTMGSPRDEPQREDQETRHEVTLSHAFWIGEHEVTQDEWESVMRTRPSHFASCGSRCPVENVSFVEVNEFLAALNRRTAGGFRLPTEAEWEYACRAGTTTAFAPGAALTRAEANFGGDGPRPVGSFPPNAWGLVDMHGNVWEWCQDRHCPYGGGPVTDPIGSCDSGLRVIRGGSWAFGADSARCALRYTHRPVDRGPSLGFRVARDPR